MKCVIIDDEVPARRLLTEYINKIPGFEVVAQFENPLQAQSFLLEKKTGLLFLDINMPEMTGIEFLRSMPKKPLTILVSAYPDYAVQSYELDVIDYLLKPVSFDRFCQSVNKALEYYKYINSTVQIPNSYENGYFFIKADYKILRIVFSDILYIEGMREYVQIVTVKQKVVAYTTMLKLLDTLPRNEFFRIHKSFIINIKKIQAIEGNLIKICGHEIQLSKGYRKDFFSRIDTLLIN